MPARKEATFLLDTDTLFKSVRNKLLESGKEPIVVIALWIIRPDPRSIDETVEYMPLERCFHLRLKLHPELDPVTLVLSMDEKGSKQVDVSMSNLLPLPVSRSLRPFSNGSWGSTRRCLPDSFHQSKFRSKPPSAS